MNKIITITTNTLEGWTIEECHDPISANLVVGFNDSNDFAASLNLFCHPFNKNIYYSIIHFERAILF